MDQSRASLRVLCECNNAIVDCPTHGNGLTTKILCGLAARRFEFRVGTYHVTEICTCLRRGYLERKHSHDETYKGLWIKQRGNALHRQVTHAFRGWKELSVCMPIALKGETINLVGHIDAYDPDRSEMTEFKSTRYLKWRQKTGKLPHEHHVLQLLAYYTIWTGSYGFPVKSLSVAYMDDETPPVPYEIEPRDMKDWLATRTIALHRSVVEDSMPEAEPGPCCIYCWFKDKCASGVQSASTCST